MLNNNVKQIHNVNRILTLTNIIITNSCKANAGNTSSESDNLITIPGFINCWSYSWQSLFRNIPEMQNAGDNWMFNLAKRVDKMTLEDFYTAARTHYLECLLGGATTVVDCLYMVKDNAVFDQLVRAANDVGIRLILIRGSMDQNYWGNKFLSPFIQDRQKILVESEAIIKKYHDTSDSAMVQVGLGPCSIKTGSKELYQETAKLARQHDGVQLFTLLGEEPDEKKVCGFPSLSQYMKILDWLGDDVIFVNTVNLELNDLKRIAQNESKIVDCPRSNARGTGISKLQEMIELEIPIGIGTAGAAGNDRCSMQDELLWARYSQGLRGLDYLKPHDVIQIGTKGGASIINRSYLGEIKNGYLADLILYDTKNTIHYAGAVTDPVGSLVGSGHLDVHTAIVNGEIVVQNGRHVRLDHTEIIRKQNETALRIEKQL
ncbi:amidohydrolase family protein [candidate division KSB1 bacterium]|nr:amidohydrolase family protein [candidate division KSB1 bacterium]